MNACDPTPAPPAPRTRRAPLIAALVVSGVALLGAACGASSGGDGAKVASLSEDEGGARSSAKAGTGNAGKDPEQAALAFARCMRENGVDVPDPQTGGNGLVKMAPGAGPLPSEEKLAEADKKCGHLMEGSGPRNLSPEDRSRLKDAMVAFAKCMRDNGVDMPDPEPGEGGGFRVRVGAGELDPQSPQFQAAEKKCQPIMADAEKKAGITREGGPS